MSSVPTYTKGGNKATTAAKLPAGVFAVMPENHELLKLAYTAYLANGRDNLAQTKTRGLVRGGGKKPWRQKGTGRARFGSTRNPIWRGGGVAFGPTGSENYSVKISLAMKRQALREALSLAASENRIKVIESFDNKDGKVSATAKLLGKLEATGNVLIVVNAKDEVVERAVHNLPRVKAVQALYLNVFDIMNADSLVVDEKALTMIGEWLESTSSNRVSQAKPATKKAPVSKGAK